MWICQKVSKKFLKNVKKSFKIMKKSFKKFLSFEKNDYICISQKQ